MSENRPTQHAAFEDTGELPWLDRPEAAAEIDRRRSAGLLSASEAEVCEAYRRDGWAILPDLRVEDELVDAINADVQALLDAHAAEPVAQLKTRLQNMFLRSPAVRRGMTHPLIVRWCGILLGRPVAPYQTLNMPVGSQIGPHADAVLMTTHPFGYMCASWLALEDVEDDAGPLQIWSGTHRWPYMSAADAGLAAGGDEEARAARYDAVYYPRNERKLAEEKITPYRFLPKKGQVLVWHANVLHAGAPVARADATRKSLITHYFARDVHHYSDLFDRPCDLPEL